MFFFEQSNDIFLEDSSRKNNIINIYGNFLVELGVNIVDFTSICKNCAKDIANLIKNKGLNFNTEKEIISMFENTLMKLGKIFIDTKKIKNNPKFLELDNEKFIASVKLFTIVVAINSIVGNILFLLTGSVGYNLCIYIWVPIIEELSKSIAIKGGFIKEYTILFNGYEIVTNTIVYGKIIGYTRIIIARLKTSLMHITTTLLQWLTSNNDILEKCGIKPDNIPLVNLIGRLLGIFIHSSWNYMSLFNEKFVNKIFGF